MRNRLILFLFGLGLWFLLSWSLDWQHVLVGIAVSAFVAFLTGDMFVKRPGHFLSPKRYLWFFYFIPLFLWECLKANIDVALRILNPRLKINPGIVKIKTKLTSDTGLTFLANSITLTPGTLCVDINPEKGLLYIHWIDVKTQKSEDAARIIAGKFESILGRIFE